MEEGAHLEGGDEAGNRNHPRQDAIDVIIGRRLTEEELGKEDREVDEDDDHDGEAEDRELVRGDRVLRGVRIQ